MAKNIQQNQAVNMTIDDYYNLSIQHSNEALDLEEAGGDQTQIDNCWYTAASGFWFTLLLGHQKAPYSLSCCLNHGSGIMPDDYLAKLFFGVALELGDEKCKRETNQQIIPPSMNQAVKDLTELIRQTGTTININDKMSLDMAIDQMPIFEQVIKPPHWPSDRQMLHLFNEWSEKSGTSPSIHPQDRESQSNYSPSEQQDHDVHITIAGQQDDNDCCCIIF